MKTLWREKRSLVIALLALLGVASLSGGLALAAVFGVKSLLGAVMWVVFAGPVLAVFTLTLPESMKSGRPCTSTQSWRVKYINPHTGQITENPVDGQGYGVGSFHTPRLSGTLER